MKLKKVIEYDKMYYMNTFGNRTPVCFHHGKGMYLWDTNDKKYMDLLGGIAVNALGHNHPKLVNAIKDQAEKLIHCSSLYYIKAQAKLAKLLTDNSFADKYFFCNSGAEANEGAIKLARIYFKKQGMNDKYEVITLKNSFHGRTMTTLAATGQEKYKEPYKPVTPGFNHVEINNIDALINTITEKTCAIMLELIQGESGVNLVSNDYLEQVRKICDEKGILLIFDEIQTGIGRTGKLFAYENFDIKPDIITLAKALGGGVPIGAVGAAEHVASAFEPGDHGSTFGGNPLACTAAISVLETIIDKNLLKNVLKTGSYFIDKLNDLKTKYPYITEVRGMGLMIGIQLNNLDALTIKNACFEKGYLVGNVGNNIIRMLPPLIITPKEVDSFIDELDSILSKQI